MVCFLQLRANALIKRGSMYMQQQQPLLSTQDFNMAAEIDTHNPDVYHHRGQVEAELVFFMFVDRWVNQIFVMSCFVL